MLSKEFILNLLFLLTINLLVKPLYAFGIDLQVQNEVGAAAYGLYFALFNFSYLVQIGSDWGLQQFNNKEIAQQPTFFHQHFRALLQLKICLGLASLGVLALAAWVVGYGAEQLYLLGFVAINHLLISLTLFLRSNLSGLQHYRLDSLLSSLDKILMLIFGFGLIYLPFFQPLRIEYLVYAQLLSYLITAFIVFLFVYKYWEKPLERPIGTDFWAKALRQSFPYALVVFLMVIYTRLDGVLLERLLPEQEGATQAGIYAFAYRLFDMGVMIGYLFASLLLPMFAKLQQQKEELKTLLSLAIHLLWTFMVALAAMAFWYSDVLTEWLCANPSPEMAQVVFALLCGLCGNALMHVYGTLLTAVGQLQQINKLLVWAILFNATLNLIFIPYFGALAAAWVSVATQFLVGLAQFYYVCRFLNIAISMSNVLQHIGFLATVVGISYLLFPLSNVIDWRINALLLGVCVLVISLIWRLLRWQDFRVLLKK